MNRRGFTLIELMLVVAVVAILAGLSIGMSGDFRRRSTFNQVAREIYNGLNRGRSEAIRRGVSVHVEITDARLTAFVDQNGDHAWQSGEGMIYQYPDAAEPVPDNVWPARILFDRSVLTAANALPIAIFDYQGFSITTAGQPLGGDIKLTDELTGIERTLSLSLAGAVIIE